MKHLIITIAFTLALISCFAQQKDKRQLLPPSFQYELKEDAIDHINVYPPSAELIAAEDAEDEKNGTYIKIARLIPVNTTVKNAGTWQILPNGKSIWQLRFSSEGAKGSALYFDKFDIPEGSCVFVYASDRSIVDGPYYRSDNPTGNEFMIGNIIDDDITIEYVAPMSKSEDGNIKYSETTPIINIGEYGYVYRDEGAFERGTHTGTRDTGFGSSESCEVNVNCPVGASWRIQQRGVARIYVREGYNAGYCTGTLINNTRNDGTAYFLTANHCGPDATASNFNQWKFRFNYESSECANPSYEYQINYTDFTGCTKIAEGAKNGGSDFFLLKLNNFSAQSAINIHAIYNGWDRSTSVVSGGGAGIHHPSGDIKKISFYTSTPTTATYNGGSDMTGASNAHWKVFWSGNGVTEGGSSGSPIFNKNGRVFGTLSGGASSCSAASSSKYDLYGKMSYHWTSNGTTNNKQLKPWLDPTNSGAMTCDYYDPAAPTTLTADFNANPTIVSAGGTVAFTDASIGNPTSWQWTFQGGTPSSSTSQNPRVVYSTAGTYNVTLRVSNGTGTDTKTKNAYIIVTAPGSNSFSYDFESCTAWSVDQFSPCSTWDGDGSVTGGITNVSFTNSGYTGSYITFQNGKANGFTAHGGSKFGCCMFAENPPNNDWFITPKLGITNRTQFTFWARSANETYGLEQFRVAVSYDDYNYTYIAGSSTTSIEAPVAWTQFSYDLSQYAGEEIFIAIICVSNDVFAFFIDDINVTSISSAEETSISPDDISIYPNPAKDNVTINLPEENATIVITNVLGQTVNTINATSSNETISVEGLDKGMYFFNIKLSDKNIIKKVIVE